MPRLFIAIELPDAVRQELTTVRQRLARRAPDFRWVAAEQMHLTLVFLGETPKEFLGEVQQAMGATAADTPPLELTLGPIGTFGRPEAPRVVWVAIQGPPALVDLQRRLTEACAARGLESDSRPFTPHLTLGRARHARGERIAVRFMDGIMPTAASFTAHEIVLFESRLGSGGPLHYAQYRVAL